MNTTILKIKNTGTQREFTLGRMGDVVVGRDNQYCSRWHATVVCEPDVLYLVDSSTNGTTVDGVKLHKGQFASLKDGSIVDLCGTRIEISASGW